jgi:hypothetical protein
VRVDNVLAALEGLTPDVFIVSDEEAVQAILPHMPPSARGVLCGLNKSLGDSLVSEIPGREHLAVVVEPLRPVQTVRMAREFTGGTGPYFLVGDASLTGQMVTEAAYEMLARPGLGGDVDRGAADTWAAWKDLVTREGGAAEFVLITAYQPLPDETGELVDGRAMMTWMLQALDVPVFSLVNSLVVDGAVGGLVADGYEQGRLAGELAMAAAEGPDELPRTGQSKLVINAAAARYWGLDIPALFPVAAEVYRSLPPLTSQSYAPPVPVGSAMDRTQLKGSSLTQQPNSSLSGTMVLSGGQR